MTTRSIVACVDDLFFRSKIEATARHLNVPVRFADAKDLSNAARAQDTAAVLAQAAISDAARREKDLEHKLEGAKADLAGLSKLLVAAHDEGSKREVVIRELKDKLQEAHK